MSPDPAPAPTCAPVRLVLDFYPRAADTVEVVIVAVDGSAACTLTFGSVLWVDSAKFCKEPK